MTVAADVSWVLKHRIAVLVVEELLVTVVPFFQLPISSLGFSPFDGFLSHDVEFGEDQSFCWNREPTTFYISSQ